MVQAKNGFFSRDHIYKSHDQGNAFINIYYMTSLWVGKMNQITAHVLVFYPI